MTLSFVCVDAGVIEFISLHFRGFVSNRENGLLIYAFLSRYCEVQREPISLQFCKGFNLVFFSWLAPAETTGGRDCIAHTY